MQLITGLIEDITQTHQHINWHNWLSICTNVTKRLYLFHNNSHHFKIGRLPKVFFIRIETCEENETENFFNLYACVWHI